MRSHPSRFPDFLVVGAAKSGTTTLHHHLARHPRVFLPKGKELWFWHQNRNPNQGIFSLPNTSMPIRLEDYLAHFREAHPDQILGEVCPSYLYYHEYTIETLKEFHPNWRDVRIIILLRDPLDRIRSEYRFVRAMRLDPERLSFAESIRREEERKKDNRLLLDLHYLALSMYTDQVKAYLDVFPNTRVYLFDELTATPETVLRDVISFLNLPPLTEAGVDRSEVHNKTVLPPVSRSRTHGTIHDMASTIGRMLLPPAGRKRVRQALGSWFFKPDQVEYDPATLDWLRQQLRPDVERLSGLLQRDLSHWLH